MYNVYVQCVFSLIIAKEIQISCHLYIEILELQNQIENFRIVLKSYEKEQTFNWLMLWTSKEIVSSAPDPLPWLASCAAALQFSYASIST